MRHDTASLRSSDAPSGPPPSYSHHDADELLTPSLYPSLHGVRRPNRRISVPRTITHPSVGHLLSVLNSSDPLQLTIDNGLIYPPPPSDALYHLPRTLTWSGNEIFLCRSLPALASRTTNGARDLALYTMKRTPFTYEITLTPRREGLKHAIMRGKRSLLGSMSWEVEVRGTLALKYTKGKWKDSAGRIVATESIDSTTVASKDEEVFDALQARLLITGGDLDIATKDLIVAAWCTRIWQGHGKVSLARTLVRGQAYVNRDFPNGRSFTQRLAGA